MKSLWESMSHDTLRIVRLISFTLAFFLLFATAYLSGWYNPASLWTRTAMYFTAGLGSMCNAGIASQRLFRSAVPHFIIAGVFWVAALYVIVFAL